MLQRSVQSKPDEKIFIELLFYEHFLLNQNGFIVLENVLRQKKKEQLFEQSTLQTFSPLNQYLTVLFIVYPYPFRYRKALGSINSSKMQYLLPSMNETPHCSMDNYV